MVASGAPTANWGWPNDPKTEELRLQFAKATDESARKKITAELQVEAYQQVLYLPLAQFTTPSAWRTDLKGVLKSPAMLLFNIEKK
jgi:peptide/nickel transport system substrate-binding protein